MSKTLEMLGYAPNDRVLIIHADDVGFSHASNVAALRGLTEGSLTCASALVAAPWFAETAQLARAHPELDFGVHLALNCEYEQYRWRSMSGRASLHAPDGGVWRDVPSVVRHVPVEDAAAELRAQLDHALAMGIDVTHIDMHMRPLIQPQYLPIYLNLAVEYRLPVFFFRLSERRLKALGESAPVFVEQERRLNTLGWPLLDNTITETMTQIAPEDKDRRFREWFISLRPGLTHFLCHPSQGGDELAALAPNDWRHRAREAEIFGSRDMRDYCESLGIKLTGYREIRERLLASL